MEDKLSFREAINLAEEIIEKFEKVEGKEWGVEGAMIELSKQIGELSKLIMVYENYYFPNRDKFDKQYVANKEKIADELADILFAIIRIAKHYRIDLEKAHIKARKMEEKSLKFID